MRKTQYQRNCKIFFKKFNWKHHILSYFRSIFHGCVKS